jgi:hypothetical protein
MKKFPADTRTNDQVLTGFLGIFDTDEPIPLYNPIEFEVDTRIWHLD